MKAEVSGSAALTEDERMLARLHESINRPGMDPSNVLDLLATWIEHEFGGEEVTDELASRFLRRIEADPPEGLKMDPERLKAIVLDRERFPHRYEARDAEKAEQLARMRSRVERLSPGKARKVIGSHGSYDNTITQAPNSASSVLRRLNRDHPELAEQVASGEISANAAAIEAGYRKRKVSIIVDPESAARSLRKHMNPDDLSTLAKLLMGSE